LWQGFEDSRKGGEFIAWIDEIYEIDVGGFESNIGLDIVVELLPTIGIAVDTKALGNKEIALHTIVIELGLGIECVIKFHLELVAVMQFNAALDKVRVLGVAIGYGVPRCTFGDKSKYLLFPIGGFPPKNLLFLRPELL
jgi:hypothetical protein